MARRWLAFTLSFVAFSLMCAAWSLSTPISASPDEPAHIIKAASVARGQFIGTPSPDGELVQVPRYVAFTQSQTCFAFHPQVSASCSPVLSGAPDQMVSAPTTAGLYNPVYYAIVGWPSLFFPTSSGIYAMRIVSGIVTSLFLALTVLMACTMKRPALPILGIAVAAPPMLYFLGGSVNPNALETTAMLAVFVTMLAIMRDPTQLIGERMAILGAAAVIGVNARALSPLWLAAAILIPLLLARGHTLATLFHKRVVWLAVVATALASGFALAWILMSGSLVGGSVPSDRTFPGVGQGPLVGFISTLEGTFSYAQGMIGIFGWLDTMAPLGVFFVWSAFVGGLVIVAIVVSRRRELAFVVTLIAAFVLVPAIVQAVYIRTGGIIWQGRYALPIFGMMVIGIGWILSDRMTLSTTSTRRLAAIALFGWGLCQWASFATALRRYSVGTDGSLRAMLLSPDWSAPLGNFTLLGIYAVIVLATAVIALWAIDVRRIQHP